MSAEELSEVPGLDDTLAFRLADRTLRPESASLPPSVRPYIVAHGKRRLRWRTRAALRDPAMSERWRRSATQSRLSFSDGGRWDGGLVVERDAGEPATADYVSGTLGYRSADGRTRAVLGHLRAHVGLGMLTSRATTFWPELAAFRPRRTSLSPTLASTESGELLGGGCLIRRSAWEVLLLATWPRWDATLDGDSLVSNFRRDGVHVTDAERRAKRVAQETYVLGHVGWIPAEQTAVGASYAVSRFSLPTRLTLEPTEPMRSQQLLGFDFRVRRLSFDLRGEVVKDARGPIAVAGALDYEFKQVTLCAAAWSYSPESVLPHGVVWSFRGEPTDESAALVGVRWSTREFRAELFGARYRQNHASRTDVLPREGQWEELRAAYSLSNTGSLKLRWRRRATWQPGKGTGGETSRNEWRIEGDWGRGPWTIRPRGDFVQSGSGGRGLLVAFKLGRPQSQRFNVSNQVAVFHSSTGDAALYLYDVRAPGYGVVQTLTGRGIAWSGRVGGTIRRFDWSLAASGLTRHSEGSDLTLTAHIEYEFP